MFAGPQRWLTTRRSARIRHERKDAAELPSAVSHMASQSRQLPDCGRSLAKSNAIRARSDVAYRLRGLIPKSALVFLFFKFLESVVTWDIQYSLPGEAPGPGNILRMRCYRFGRPFATWSTGNVRLASATPANPSNSVTVLPLGCSHRDDRACSRCSLSSRHSQQRGDGRSLSITARNRIQLNPNAIAEHLAAN